MKLMFYVDRNWTGFDEYTHLRITGFDGRLSWNPAESLVYDFPKQLNVLHRAASCLSCPKTIITKYAMGSPQCTDTEDQVHPVSSQTKKPLFISAKVVDIYRHAKPSRPSQQQFAFDLAPQKYKPPLDHFCDLQYRVIAKNHFHISDSFSTLKAARYAWLIILTLFFMTVGTRYIGHKASFNLHRFTEPSIVPLCESVDLCVEQADTTIKWLVLSIPGANQTELDGLVGARNTLVRIIYVHTALPVSPIELIEQVGEFTPITVRMHLQSRHQSGTVDKVSYLAPDDQQYRFLSQRSVSGCQLHFFETIIAYDAGYFIAAVQLDIQSAFDQEIQFQSQKFGQRRGKIGGHEADRASRNGRLATYDNQVDACRKRATIRANGSTIRLQLDRSSDKTNVSRRAWRNIISLKYRTTMNTARNASGGTYFPNSSNLLNSSSWFVKHNQFANDESSWERVVCKRQRQGTENALGERTVPVALCSFSDIVWRSSVRSSLRNSSGKPQFRVISTSRSVIEIKCDSKRPITFDLPPNAIVTAQPYIRTASYYNCPYKGHLLLFVPLYPFGIPGTATANGAEVRPYSEPPAMGDAPVLLEGWRLCERTMVQRNRAAIPPGCTRTPHEVFIARACHQIPKEENHQAIVNAACATVKYSSYQSFYPVGRTAMLC
ncbi:hypothetical protein CLF_110377, partial [Clonorchis sinensis]